MNSFVNRALDGLSAFVAPAFSKPEPQPQSFPGAWKRAEFVEMYRVMARYADLGQVPSRAIADKANRLMREVLDQHAGA